MNKAILFTLLLVVLIAMMAHGAPRVSLLNFFAIRLFGMWRGDGSRERWTCKRMNTGSKLAPEALPL